MYRLTRTLSFRLAFCAVTATALAACTPEAPPPPPPPAVTVADALQREVNDWDEFTGRLVAVDSVEIRPQVTGTIEQVAFEAGHNVRKGDLLFRLDDRVPRAALERAEAELAAARSRTALARDDFARADRLLAAQAVSAEERAARATALAQAEAAEQVARAAVSSARASLSYTRITSPITGRVGKAEITVGNLVTAGGGAPLLTTVVSLDPIFVEFEGDEQVYLKYTEMSRRGERPSSRDAANPVFMALAGETGFPHEGRMVFVDNALNPATGTIRARAEFRNADRVFTPGLFARVKLIGSGRYPAVLVDDKAVGTDQGQKFLLVIGKDNVVEYRPVKLGRIVDGLRVVAEGLKAGETIIVNGLQRVRPGAKVTVTKVAMDAGVAPTDKLTAPDVPAAPAAPTEKKSG